MTASNRPQHKEQLTKKTKKITYETTWKPKQEQQEQLSKNTNITTRETQKKNRK